jgi:hypothetical protein
MKKEENNEKEYTPWEVRAIRELCFMSFGSNQNSFATINEGKGITLEEFKKISKELFALSLEEAVMAVNYAKKFAEKSQNLDFPKK